MHALLDAISRQPNISIFENHLAIDLVTSQKLGYVGANRCLGAYVFDKKTGTVETFAAPVTLLATGGAVVDVPPLDGPQIADLLRTRFGAEPHPSLTEQVLRSHRMDDVATLGGRFTEEQPTLIWICFHVLQEYARHLGHLDVAVELTGGPTGEGPQ